MPLLFVGSGIFQYIGAAVAVGLFTLMSPLGVVWWRVALGAVVLALLWRPWRLEWTPRALALAAIFGVSLAVMNGLFYEAIARLPLGTVVAIEFLGPVVVAVIRGKGMLPRIAAALALAGIILIGGWGTDLGAPQATAGFLFALGAAGSWAAYILLGSYISGRGAPRRRVGSSRAESDRAESHGAESSGAESHGPESSGAGSSRAGGKGSGRKGALPPTMTGPSLAMGALFAAVVSLPFLYGEALRVDFTWTLVVMLAAVGVFSTAIPYSIEAIAFGRIPADTFALLTALLPATSTFVGAIMLRQIPNGFELLGLLLVSVAVWMATRAPQHALEEAARTGRDADPEDVGPDAGQSLGRDAGQSLGPDVRGKRQQWTFSG